MRSESPVVGHGAAPGVERRSALRIRHRALLGAVFRTVSLVTASLLAGCGGDTTSPEVREEVAIFGYLYVGEALDEENAILITRTRPVDEYYDQEKAVVQGALVTVRKQGSNRADTLAMIRPGYYANSKVRILPRTTYHLSVTMEGEPPITATTTTPHPFEMVDEPLETPEVMRHDDIPDLHPMRLTCPDEEQIFLLDVYCQEDWSDARYINPFGDHDRPDDYDEYGGDNGEPRHIFAYFRIKNIEREGGRFEIDFYGAMMAFYGGYEVQLLSIDDNFYSYLYRDHPEESGGIEGGIGVFGSAHRQRYAVKVVE